MTNLLKCVKNETFSPFIQDSFLPHIEDGTIILIGATTENPSFQVNNALMSRCKVVTLEKLSTEEVVVILQRAAKSLNVSVIDKITGAEDLSTENERYWHVLCSV